MNHAERYEYLVNKMAPYAGGAVIWTLPIMLLFPDGFPSGSF